MALSLSQILCLFSFSWISDLVDPVGVFSFLWLLLLEFEVPRRLCGEASFSGYWVPNSGRRDRVGPLTRAPLVWTARRRSVFSLY